MPLQCPPYIMILATSISYTQINHNFELLNGYVNWNYIIQFYLASNYLLIKSRFTFQIFNQPSQSSVEHKLLSSSHPP